MKLQGNRLVCVNAGIYDLKVPNSQIGKYTLARSMTLYFPPSCSKPIGTLPSGTSFTATKIMVADVEAVYDTVEVR